MLQLSPAKTRPSALRHGAWSRAAVLAGEDPRQFDRLYRDLLDEWRPSGPAEEDAVFTLAKCIWRKRHIQNLRDESSLGDDYWVPQEVELEERLDRAIDRALRRLGQIKAMKEMLAVERNAPKALPSRGAPSIVEE